MDPPQNQAPQYDVEVLEKCKHSLPTKEHYDVAVLQHSYHIYNEEMYREMYHRSIHDSENFWRDIAMANLRWSSPFTKVRQSNMANGEIAWFLNGKLNVCDNCVDRWAELHPSRTALIYEGDEPTNTKYISYEQLRVKVCKFANMLTRLGVRKFDTVGFYMPMCPELVYGMLACARIGAIHVVIFAGFSALNLRERLNGVLTSVLVTADQAKRGGKEIPLKSIADEALLNCPTVKTCIVFKLSGNPVSWNEGRDISGIEVMHGMRPYCPCVDMDAEDLLFVLHTSGSTGEAKGVAHSSAGYLLYAAITHKYIFDYHPGNIFACVADIGWITGHSYVVYGPLCNGATSLIFGSVPTYPDAGRYWSMVERHRITTFYTSPTAIRSLMKYSEKFPAKYDLTSLRILGSVGEPINPEAWRWFHSVIGRGKCSVVDTYWQTETGGHMLAPLPGAIRTKPGSATVPFFGVEPVILHPVTGKEVEGQNVSGLLAFKRDWPGMMRTIYNDHTRIFQSYLEPFPGYYFSGDGAFRDEDGYYWITGRVDDMINAAGHRLSAAEVEHALSTHRAVAECAAVSCPDAIKGNGLFCFVVLKNDFRVGAELLQELTAAVREFIGPVATPDYIVCVDALPKTSSGKITRRHLRRITEQESDLGTTDTVINTDVFVSLRAAVNAAYATRSPLSMCSNAERASTGA